jgi:hypothetical protein
MFWKELGPEMSCPTDHDTKNWHQIIEGTQALRDGSVRLDANWTYRFLFAIYKNAELKSRIKGLQNRVSQLQKTSIVLYQQQHENRTGEPTYSQLQQTATLQEERLRLLQFLNELFQDNSASDLRWALELGNPSLKLALSRLRGTSRVQLEFIFKAHLATGVYQHDIKIPYSKSCKMHRPRLLNDGRVGSNTKSAGWPRPQFRSPRQFHLKTLESLDVYDMSVYALAAVATARSTILLYKSSWVHGLCFCGISVYDTIEPERTLAYFPQENCMHVNHLLRKEVFLLLAVLLAELALGARIQVHHPSTTGAAIPVFEVPVSHLLPGFNIRMTWENLSELLSEHVHESPHHFVSFEYLEAVDYCYELSQRLTRREFVNDDLDTCITRIETP